MPCDMQRVISDMQHVISINLNHKIDGVTKILTHNLRTVGASYSKLRYLQSWNLLRGTKQDRLNMYIQWFCQMHYTTFGCSICSKPVEKEDNNQRKKKPISNMTEGFEHNVMNSLGRTEIKISNTSHPRFLSCNT